MPGQSGGKSFLCLRLPSDSIGLTHTTLGLEGDLRTHAGDDRIRERVVQLLIARDGVTRRNAERRLRESDWDPEGLRCLERAHSFIGKQLPHRLLEMAERPADELQAAAAPGRATGDIAERLEWLNPSLPVRGRELSMSGDVDVASWRRRMRYAARFPESVSGYPKLNRHEAIGVLAQVPGESAQALYAACSDDQGRSEPHLLVTPAGQVYWSFAVARRLPSGELRAAGAVTRISMKVDMSQPRRALAVANEYIEREGIPTARAIGLWDQQPCITVSLAFLAHNALDGDLVDMLGPERCRHQDAGWLHDSEAMCRRLHCSDCGRLAIACVPHHQLPERDELSSASWLADYLRVQGFHDLLAGREVENDWRGLVTRDPVMLNRTGVDGGSESRKGSRACPPPGSIPMSCVSARCGWSSRSAPRASRTAR